MKVYEILKKENLGKRYRIINDDTFKDVIYVLEYEILSDNCLILADERYEEHEELRYSINFIYLQYVLEFEFEEVK